ncbi:MAG: ATP synthase subunit I [Syntrophotaleaceae bacterium]
MRTIKRCRKLTNFCRRSFRRRNWLLWIGMMAASLLWQSKLVFFGVAAGGLVAIGSFYWLRWSLTRLLAKAVEQKPSGHIYPVLLRLFLPGCAAVPAGIGPAQVSPPALAVGLSVVVFSNGAHLWSDLSKVGSISHDSSFSVFSVLVEKLKFGYTPSNWLIPAISITSPMPGQQWQF